jgi:hypothetical protein
MGATVRVRGRGRWVTLTAYGAAVVPTVGPAAQQLIAPEHAWRAIEDHLAAIRAECLVVESQCSDRRESPQRQAEQQYPTVSRVLPVIRMTYPSMAPQFPVCGWGSGSMVGLGAPGSGCSSAVHSRSENRFTASGRQSAYTLLVSVHWRVLALARGKCAARSQPPTSAGADARPNRKTRSQPEPAVRPPFRGLSSHSLDGTGPAGPTQPEHKIRGYLSGHI